MIRIALHSDSSEIARVHVRSWQAAYRGHFPQEYLDQLNPSEREELWSRVLVQQPGTCTLAEENGEIVGFVHCTPSRDSDAEAVPTKLPRSTWFRRFGAKNRWQPDGLGSWVRPVELCVVHDSLDARWERTSSTVL